MILSNFSTEVSMFPVADGNVLYLKKYCYQHLPWRTDDYSLRPRWLSHDVQPWLLRWNFAPVLVWNFCGDCLTTYTTMTFAAILCTSAGVKLLRWLSDDIRLWLLLRYFAPVLVWNFCGDCLTTYDHDFCCETLHQCWCETFAVIVWRHTTITFAVKLCTSSGVKLLRWLSDDIYDYDFCCDTLHQCWCETFAVIVWRHTTMTFAAILCTSSGVKLLRWLSDDIRLWLLLWNFAPVLVWNFCGDCLMTYDYDFRCETLHQFWCETFAVIVWRHTTMTFAVKLCTSSGVKLLRWLSDDIRPRLLLWNFAPVLMWNFCGDCLTTYDHDFCCETLHQCWCETFAVIVWRHTTMTFAAILCTSAGVKLLRWLSDDIRLWLLLWNFAPVLVWNFCGDCLTTYKHDFCCETLHQFWCETFAVIVWRHTTMTFAVKLCTSSGVKLLRWLSDDIQTWLLLGGLREGMVSVPFDGNSKFNAFTLQFVFRLSSELL